MRLAVASIKSSRIFLALTCAAALGLGRAAPAQGARALITDKAIVIAKAPGSVEGACGLAVYGGLIYVSDYYHHAIQTFALLDGTPLSKIPFASDSGPCQLATSAGGALYTNDWHEGAERVTPSPLSFDGAESTGVAVDQATGNLYVNDRTYVAVYDPSGVPLMKIGEGSLIDGYGLAVFGGKVYVPDAAGNTVKAYEPAVDISNPAFTIDGAATPQQGFHSLVDAAVAVDPTNGHLLVLDNLQPGFEHPLAAIDEFDSTGAFLGQLAQKLIDGGPSGLAFSGANLYATSGNSEASKVLKFTPYSAGGAESLAGSEAKTSASSPQTPVSSTKRDTSPATLAPQTLADVIQRGDVRVSFDGKLAPKALPRHGSAPVKVAVAAKIAGVDGKEPPQLRAISIAINRYGHFDPAGLPLCPEREIQPATTANALAACRDALVGEGQFSAKVLFSQQAPFPADGKVYAFNARIHGRPAILAHVYGTDPVPTSFTLPFELKPAKGTYGTVLRAALPDVIGNSGYITGLSMTLGRNFSDRGKRRSYLSASCPAPKGFNKAVFPLAHVGFDFKGGKSLGSTLIRSCGVR